MVNSGVLTAGMALTMCDFQVGREETVWHMGCITQKCSGGLYSMEGRMNWRKNVLMPSFGSNQVADVNPLGSPRPGMGHPIRKRHREKEDGVTERQ